MDGFWNLVVAEGIQRGEGEQWGVAAAGRLRRNRSVGWELETFQGSGLLLCFCLFSLNFNFDFFFPVLVATS